MTADLRPYAFTVQTDTSRCLVCGEKENQDNLFVAVCTPRRGLIHWLHHGDCHDQHSAKCRAERDEARAAMSREAAA